MKRLMKRLAPVLAAILLVCSTGMTYRHTSGTNVSGQTAQLDYSELLKNDIERLIDRQMRAYNWKLINVHYTQLSSNLNKNCLETTWMIELNHRLNYDKPESVPAMAGKLSALNDYKDGLNSINLELVEKDVGIWKSNLQEYINEDQYMSEIIKIGAQLDDAENIIPKSVNIFIQNDDEFVPSDEFTLHQDDETIYDDYYNATMNRISTNKNIGTVTPESDPYEGYSHTRAVSYANLWTKTTQILFRNV